MTQCSTTNDANWVDVQAVCANCKYVSSNNNKHICRRGPPITDFPVVAVDDWCGEFKYNKEIEAKRRERFITALEESRIRAAEYMAAKPFNGYKSGKNDYVIYGYRLICTCGACPEQYDVFDDNTGLQVGYLRLRHGHFRADLRACGGPCVYEADTIGDGVFDEKERMLHLKKAVNALKAALYASVKQVKREWVKRD